MDARRNVLGHLKHSFRPRPLGSPVLGRKQASTDTAGFESRHPPRRRLGRGPGVAVGQDAALAAGLARRFVTVGGIIQEVERAIDDGIRTARQWKPLAEGSPLAVSHGTRYPIVQGPMTRVSDTAAFARAVADGGALPFLALALMRGPEVRALLAEAATRLDGQPWGVGILGFVPPELRREQEGEIRAAPPFALIAGGRPDQARSLERDGIATISSRRPACCGSSWPTVRGGLCSKGAVWRPRRSPIELRLVGTGIRVLRSRRRNRGRGDSSSSPAAFTMPGRGSRRPSRASPREVGWACSSGRHTCHDRGRYRGQHSAAFQAEALRCSRTVCSRPARPQSAPDPFTETFEQERRSCSRTKGRPTVRAALEGLNAGRLRVASRGIGSAAGQLPLVALRAAPARGARTYMLGQAAVPGSGRLDRRLHTTSPRNAFYLERAARDRPAVPMGSPRFGRGDRRDGALVPGARMCDVSGEHPARWTRHRSPRRSLGLARL